MLAQKQLEGNKKVKAFEHDRRFQQEWQIFCFKEKEAALFNQKVFGPIMIEVDVHASHRGMVEKALGGACLRTFVVQNKQDKDTLINYAESKGLQLNVKQCDMSRQANSSVYPLDLDANGGQVQHLKGLGLEGWLDQLIECPDQVRSILRIWANCETVGVIKAEAKTDQIFEEFRKIGKKNARLISPQTMFSATVSRYSSQLSTNTSSVLSGSMLVEGNSGNEAMIQGLQQQQVQLEDDIEHLNEKIQKAMLGMNKHKQQQTTLTSEEKTLKALPQTRKKIEKKINNIDSELDRLKGQVDVSQAVATIDGKIRKAERRKIKPLISMPGLIAASQKCIAEKMQLDWQLSELRDEISHMKRDIQMKQQRASELQRKVVEKRQKVDSAKAIWKTSLGEAKAKGKLTEDLNRKIEEIMVTRHIACSCCVLHVSDAYYLCINTEERTRPQRS